MTGQIPARTMRLTLQTMKENSGSQYGHLLAAAGLARYSDMLPPDDWTPSATSAELAELYHTVYTMLGESLTRLFLRNYGQGLARAVLEQKWGQAMLAQAPNIPASQRVHWFVDKWLAHTGQHWTLMTVAQDSVAWYLTPEFCQYCARISGVSAPLCAATEVMLRTVAEKIVGWRVRVVEIECAAMGAPHCKYAIYKDSTGLGDGATAFHGSFIKQP